MSAQWMRDLQDEQEQRMALHSVQAAEGFAAQDLSLASLNPEQATALLVRLATLEAMEQRARAILATKGRSKDRYDAAAEILGEDG